MLYFKASLDCVARMTQFLEKSIMNSRPSSFDYVSLFIQVNESFCTGSLPL